MGPLIYCGEVCAVLNLGDVSCCLSCHEDEEFGYEMCEYDMPGGFTAYTCCAVMRASEDKRNEVQ